MFQSIFSKAIKQNGAFVPNQRATNKALYQSHKLEEEDDDDEDEHEHSKDPKRVLFQAMLQAAEVEAEKKRSQQPPQNHEKVPAPTEANKETTTNLLSMVGKKMPSQILKKKPTKVLRLDPYGPVESQPQQIQTTEYLTTEPTKQSSRPLLTEPEPVELTDEQKAEMVRKTLLGVRRKPGKIPDSSPNIR